MPEKTEQEILERLTCQQNRLTFELTEWLVEQYYCFPADPRNSEAALLQRWVGLLVQSLLESVKNNQPELMADFVVVLRYQGAGLYEAGIWRAALGWLGTRCHRLLKQEVALPGYGLIRREEDEDFCYQQRETLEAVLDQVDLALRTAGRELDPQKPPLPGLLNLRRVEISPAVSRFSLN